MRAVDLEETDEMQKLYMRYLAETANLDREKFDFMNWYWESFVMPQVISLNEEFIYHPKNMEQPNKYTRTYYLHVFFTEMDNDRRKNWKAMLNQNLMTGKRPELESQWQDELAVLEKVELMMMTTKGEKTN